MRYLGYFAVAVGAIATAGYSLAALLFRGIQSPVYRELITNVEWSGKLHVVSGALALVVGLFQFSKRIRTWSIEIHKMVGRIYVALVLLSTVGAIVSLPASSAGVAARSAFWCLAVLWPIVTIAGYPVFREFSVTRHVRFMILSFALTCSAIALRIYLAVMLAFGLPFEVCYPIASWGGLITSLVAASVVFVRMQRSGRSSASVR